MSDDERPSRRSRTVGGRVDEGTYRKARDRAAKEGLSLGELIRRFLFGWADGEFQTPPPPKGEGRRARRRPPGEE